MNAADLKMSGLMLGNVSLNGFTLLIQKSLPILSFVLVILQIIGAAAVVWHIIKKRKNEKIPTPPDI